MGERTPSAKDLVTTLYRPRETMRRILNSGEDRWSVGIVILACICSSVGDLDVRALPRALPGLSLTTTLSIVAFGVLVEAVAWVIALYLLAWLATLVGRFLEGQATVADVRAALAWSLVPVIWSVVLRIPLAFYRHQFDVHGTDPGKLLADFVEHGGCTLAVVVLALQLALTILVLFVASGTVAEALRFSTWKGLSTIAITLLIPVVITVAAVLALRR